MSYLANRDPYLEIARGAVANMTSVNKFGRAPSGIDTGTGSTVWSYATTTPLWVAPTTARVHAITSTDDNDGKTGSPTSTGARTIRVYGLTSWATAETSEVVTLDGTTGVNTANSYVIIHRMKVLTMGTSGPNVGTIKATAATDTTVTAVISAGDGQTEMAVYGVPSTQSSYITRWAASIDKASGAAASVDFELRVNEQPDVLTTSAAYLLKDDISVQSTGSNHAERNYGVPVKFAGPCVILVKGIASANDTDGKSGFDLVLVTN